MFKTVVLVCGSLFLLVLVGAFGAAAERPVQIIAHRGASHDAPENTLAALRLGFEQASDAGELDVWISRDGIPVVIHDADTKRIGGVPRKVAEQSLAELRQLDMGAWKAPRFAGERLPTLVEALATVPSDKRMFVEIKCGVEGVAAILAAIREAKLSPRQTPIISFHADVIAAVKQARPDLAAYWIVSWKKDKEGRAASIESLIDKAREIRAEGLDLSESPLLDAAAVAAVRQAQLELYVWTVDDADAARRLVTLGIDGITTNRPGWLRAQLALPEPAAGDAKK